MTSVFILFLGIFLLIGVSSAFFKQKNSADYLLAGQNVKPWMVALSAVATNNSGYMFIGMIGFTYKFGLSSIWIMIGWIIGDFIASTFVYKKIRRTSGTHDLQSFGELVSVIATGKNHKSIRLLIGVISISFLTIYAAAQFGAGAKALITTLQFNKFSIIVGSALLVLIYSIAGGIRASVWTDAAQSFVMLFAMFALVFMAIQYAGGINSSIQAWKKLSPTYLDFFPNLNNNTSKGTQTVLFIIGWLFAGFGVIGQPHIMVRYMTLNHEKGMKEVKIWYYSWFTVFYALTILVGMLSKITLQIDDKFDPETALPLLALQILPEYMVGIILAGIFAATISTADSLIISSSASVTNDVYAKLKGKYWMNKLATILICILALIIALYAQKSIFDLVIYSWAVLGASLGTPIAFGALNFNLSKSIVISMIITSALTCVLWRQFKLHLFLNEIVPGILIPSIMATIHLYIQFSKKIG